MIVHVCPGCGYYDCDPILKRSGGIRCFRCGSEARDNVDLTRTAPSARDTVRKAAFDSAPLMVATPVTPAPRAKEAE